MQAFIQKLNSAPEKEKALGPYLEEALREMGKPDNPHRLFAHIFRFFESHPEADLGMPGPLVHWLEGYYPDYIDKLKESIERHPTYHTVWMASRILNAEESTGDTHRLMMRLLSEAIKHEKADDLCVETARQFLSLHLEKINGGGSS